MTIRKWYKIDCPCGASAEIFDVRNKEAIRAFRRAGWLIGSSQEGDLCPSCKKANPLVAMPLGVDLAIEQVAAYAGLSFIDAQERVHEQIAAGKVQVVADERFDRPRFRRVSS